MKAHGLGGSCDHGLFCRCGMKIKNLKRKKKNQHSKPNNNNRYEMLIPVFL
jgi:hypothetical protein